MKSRKKNEVKPISSFLEDEFNSGNSNILISFFSIHQILSKIKNREITDVHEVLKILREYCVQDIDNKL